MLKSRGQRRLAQIVNDLSEISFAKQQPAEVGKAKRDRDLEEHWDCARDSEPAQKALRQNQQAPVNSPKHIIPGGAVPQTADGKRSHQIKRGPGGTASAATERDVNEIAE